MSVRVDVGFAADELGRGIAAGGECSHGGGFRGEPSRPAGRRHRAATATLRALPRRCRFAGRLGRRTCRFDRHLRDPRRLTRLDLDANRRRLVALSSTALTSAAEVALRLGGRAGLRLGVGDQKLEQLRAESAIILPPHQIDAALHRALTDEGASISTRYRATSSASANAGSAAKKIEDARARPAKGPHSPRLTTGTRKTAQKTRQDHYARRIRSQPCRASSARNTDACSECWKDHVRSANRSSYRQVRFRSNGIIVSQGSAHGASRCSWAGGLSTACAAA